MDGRGQWGRTLLPSVAPANPLGDVMMSPSVPAVLAALVLCTAGCYRLTPVEGGVPAQGQEVFVTLTDEGSTRLAPLVGPRIEAVDGRSLATTDSSFVLAVNAVVARGGRSMPWSLERLEVPRVAVASVRGRTLDRRKSWIVAGLSVAAVLALGDSFGLGTGFGNWVGLGSSGGKK